MVEIIPPHLAIKAMRDNGYKNAAYAIAELMDNSIQADATDVQLLCLEKNVLVNHKWRTQLKSVAVYDNGKGMDAETFLTALQFGNGTHLNAEDQKGIGRFGMGLPSASISQAKRVDVYTWTESSHKALHLYLDIDEIIDGRQKGFSQPLIKKIPDEYFKIVDSLDKSKSGTIVIWHNLDKCAWKTAKSLIDNSEFLIGRIYRHFLANCQVRIEMLSYTYENGKIDKISRLAKMNDPLYLMQNTSCPYNDGEPLFEPFPNKESFILKIEIEKNNIKYPVDIKYSIVKSAARRQPNAGASNYGKHASKNMGISIVRADRELALDTTLLNGYDPRERWWGIEVSFPPELDEVFGVTNNKQSAVNFTEVVSFFNDSKEDISSFNQFKEELLEDQDIKFWLIDLVNRLSNQRHAMMSMIKLQKEGSLVNTRHQIQDDSPEADATKYTIERTEDKQIGLSDIQANEMTVDQKKDAIRAVEEFKQLPEDEQDIIIEKLFGAEALKYQFIKADLDTSAFFSVKPKGGKIVISLNINHPAYDNLIEVLDEDEEIQEDDKTRLSNASKGLKLLLMAWARFEDEELAKNRETLQDVRADWGKIARVFLKTDD